MNLTPFEYEVVTVDEQGEICDRTQRQNVYRSEDLGNNIILKLVRIPGGSFQMGTDLTESQRFKSYNSESPQHPVSLQPFLIGMTPITRAQYQAVMGGQPERLREIEVTPQAQAKLNQLEEELNKWLQEEENMAQWSALQAWMQQEQTTSQLQEAQRQHHPVEGVSWQDAVEFCERLSSRTGRTYRLPSEAEWEYACRAGTETPFYFGETITTDLANYGGVDEEIESWGTNPRHYGEGLTGVYRGAVTDVGHFPPNAFGLYDMHGTVWEWCADYSHKSYKGAPTDGSVWDVPDRYGERVLRGGSWKDRPECCRSAYRHSLLPDNAFDTLGFRVCFSP